MKHKVKLTKMLTKQTILKSAGFDNEENDNKLTVDNKY